MRRNMVKNFEKWLIRENIVLLDWQKEAMESFFKVIDNIPEKDTVLGKTFLLNKMLEFTNNHNRS